MGDRRRLTVSLVLRGRVADEVDGLRRALGAAALARIAPHLTLVPPRNVAEEELEEVLALLRRAAAACPPLRLELGPPATFAPVAPVLYLEVAGDLEELFSLRQALSKGPLRPPPGRPEREFVPHVTIDQSIDPGRIEAALTTLGSYRASLTVAEVTLLQFAADARRWLPLASAALGEARVVGRGGVEIELCRAEMLDPEAARFKEDEWAAYSAAAYGSYQADRPFAVTARRGGEVVGTATGQLQRGSCRLGNLIVSAAARNNGIGAKLVGEVERLAAEEGAARVRLETRAGGPAEGFYRRLGYEATAVLPAWREGRDFLLMEKAISPRPG